ncbi:MULTISPECIES: hypothetical protein [unclassified Nocardia]|uniref:hypothetical protein n=1 Tax=unclassified Nocardia TaxID=2637762 RepID=UPI001CE3F4FF|nr:MULTISPECIES: hypothetical protein [unclassified Nocardia]
MSHRTDITLLFGEGAHAFADENRLEWALADIARLLWIEWQRRYRRVVEEETDLIIDAVDSRDFNFFADRAEVEVSGASRDGRIRISSTGMADFSVRVEPGTMREISGGQLSANFSEAATELLRDLRAKVGELKRRYYG